MLSRSSTWTATRDTSLGLNFAGVNYYDGQGFLVNKDLGVTSAKELDGASFCIQAGTTTELNLTDYFKSNKPPESANIARDRLLQILIAHPGQHSDNSRRRLIKTLEREILNVVAKHVNIHPNSININLEKDGDTSILELNVTLPENH